MRVRISALSWRVFFVFVAFLVSEECTRFSRLLLFTIAFKRIREMVNQSFFTLLQCYYLNFYSCFKAGIAHFQHNCVFEKRTGTNKKKAPHIFIICAVIQREKNQSKWRFTLCIIINFSTLLQVQTLKFEKQFDDDDIKPELPTDHLVKECFFFQARFSKLVFVGVAYEFK